MPLLPNNFCLLFCSVYRRLVCDYFERFRVDTDGRLLFPLHGHVSGDETSNKTRREG